MLKLDLRILFLIRSLNFGGAERQLVALARSLHQRGHSVAVAVFYPNGPLQKDLEEAQVPVISLKKRHRWDLLGFLLRLIRLLQQEKPDILHGYSGTSNILTVLLKPFFPRIHMVWGVRASNMDLRRYDWISRLAYRVECLLSRFADLIIANSHAGLDYAAENGFPREKMLVIANGIDTNSFRPNPEVRSRLRAEWGISENKKLIGLVGRLDPMKDHPTFLKAAALLCQERKDVRFVCVGDGNADYRQKLLDLSLKLGLMEHIIWAGARVDMPNIYNALDIAVSSSSFGEGFSNVIGEAMSSGVPCVVTDVGDSAWIVGDVGIVVQPGDPQALARGLRDVLSGIPGLKPHRIRERIVNMFSVEVLVKAAENTLANNKK